MHISRDITECKRMEEELASSSSGRSRSLIAVGLLPLRMRGYENLSMGSRLTAKEGAKILYRFLKNHEDISTPMSLVEIAKRERREVENIRAQWF